MSGSQRTAFFLALLMILLSSSPSDGRKGSEADVITAAAIRGHVFYLASDDLGGRYMGSPGYETAALYAASQFRAAGLAAVIEQDGRDTYLQGVPLLRRTAREDLSLVIETADGERTFAEEKDFKWFQGEIFHCEDRRLQVVFAGYGIGEPAAGWDDLEGLDLRGKAVVIMMGAPVRDGKPVLPEALHALYSPPESAFRKLGTLFHEGAAAVFVVPDRMIIENWEALTSQTRSAHFACKERGAGALNIPGLYVMKPEVAAAMFAGQDRVPAGMGGPGMETEAGFELEKVFLTLKSSFQAEELGSWNVVGMVEGTDPALRNSYIVVTAHLDGRAPGEGGEINNAADDDAGGCAAVMEIAEAVALCPPRRSVIFALLTGEEAMCAGSRYFVSHCPVPPGDVAADINLDMIGRTEPSSQADRGHYAIGSGEITKEFTRIIKDVNARTVNWPLKYENVLGTSDHVVFHAANIPAVNFYSGHHPDVHEPTDDADRLDYEKAREIARLVYELTVELGNRDGLW